MLCSWQPSVPIASYAFSPPCFACCFALAPRRFLFHVPCLANSYAQHRRSNSSTSCFQLKHFLSQELSQVAPATSCPLLLQVLHHETIIATSFCRLPSMSWGSPGGTSGKEPPYQCRILKDMDLISGSGLSPGGRHGNPLQFSCLENPMDRGSWQSTIHSITKSRTQLNN